MGRASFPQAPEWKAHDRSDRIGRCRLWPLRSHDATGLHSEVIGASSPDAATVRAATAIAAVLVREGVDYAQSKAVFSAARRRAGLSAPPERRGGVDRLTVEEELRFLDRAYAQGGPDRLDAADAPRNRRAGFRAGPSFGSRT